MEKWLDFGLALIGKLEKVWPCAVPFLLALGLTPALRWLHWRDFRKMQRELRTEREQRLKRKKMNGSADSGRNGA